MRVVLQILETITRKKQKNKIPILQRYIDYESYKHTSILQVSILS